MSIEEQKRSLDIVDIIQQSVDLKKHGHEFNGLCPFHAEKTPSFTVNQHKQFFHCFGCGESGDVIAFVRKRDNASFAAACRTLGIDLPNQSGKKTYRSMRTPEPPQHHGAGSSPAAARECPLPSEKWLQAADKFVSWCTEQLLASQEAMNWLGARGITRETAVAHRLGWNPGREGKAIYRPRAEWGLTAEINQNTGRKKTLWLPIGWVLPMLDNGHPIQIRIRRTADDIKNFLPEMKYRVVPGSCMAAMLLGSNMDAYAICENGFDAILLQQQAGDIIGSCTTWSATTMPDSKAHKILSAAESILLATDFDSAGRKGASRLLSIYPQAKWWPVPTGNDIGDAWAAGIDLRSWLMDGLPPAYRIKTGDDRDISLIDNFGGQGRRFKQGAGNEKIEKNEDKEKAANGGPVVITLQAGQDIYLTNDRDDWEAACAAGKIVFTGRELTRLRAALDDLKSDKERKIMIDAVLATKQEMGPAYISRGAKVV